MQNWLEHKEDLFKWAANPAPGVAGGGAADPDAARSGRGGTDYFAASSVETSFSETELMQKRWSVGVP